MTDKTLGITVMPEWIQVEGIEPVLDRLQRAGATAIATSPYVMAPAPDGQGGREPPADGGAGKVRLLDRPLFGRRELWVQTAPSFEADKTLYEGLRYQPEAPSDLTHAEGPKVGAFIEAAKARGLEVFLQVQAAIPPGYRVQFGGPTDDDQALLPNGKPVPGRVDKNGTLASPHIKAYTVALLRDLARAYPGIDGFRIDWPEYPPYAFDSLFLDFSPHAMAAAARLGLDTNAMRRDMLALRGWLAGHLDEATLGALLDPDGGRYALLRRLVAWPGLFDMLRLKRQLVVELLEACRAGLPEKLSADAAILPAAMVARFRLRLWGRGTAQRRHRRQALHHALADDAARLRRGPARRQPVPALEAGCPGARGAPRDGRSRALLGRRAQLSRARPAPSGWCGGSGAQDRTGPA